MPVGGLGAGCICVNGYGGLQDFSIRTRPETTALPAGFTSNSPEAAFAILHIKGATPVTKLIEGPFPAFKIFDQGFRARVCAVVGSKDFRASRNAISAASFRLPRFDLPISPFPSMCPSSAGTPSFLSMTRTPESPARSSNTPCTTLRPARSTIEFSYHLSHLAPGCRPDQAASANAVIPGKGAFLFNREAPNAESFGSASLTVIGGKPQIKAMWLRSPGWEFDSLSALWREVSTGNFTPTKVPIPSTIRPKRRFHPAGRTSRPR